MFSPLSQDEEETNRHFSQRRRSLKTLIKGLFIPLILGGCTVYTSDLLNGSPASAGSSGASLGSGGKGSDGKTAGSSGTASQGGVTASAGGANDVVTGGQGGMSDSEPAVADWLHVDGNQILHEDGSLFRGRGAHIFDTRQCGTCSWTDPVPVLQGILRRIDVLVDQWHANFISLNLTSYASNMSGDLTLPQWDDVVGDPAYAADLTTIVEYIGSKPGAYVILTLEGHPSLDAHGLPTATTLPVWEKLSAMFKQVPYVLYATARSPGGATQEEGWEAMNNVVAAIRSQEDTGKQHLIAAVGLQTQSDALDYFLSNPILAGKGVNIIYAVNVVAHPDNFESLFLSPSKYLPVIIGSFGAFDPDMTLDDAAALMPLADEAGVPYLAWAFSASCAPRMLVFMNGLGECVTEPSETPSAWGTAVKNHLAKNH